VGEHAVVGGKRPWTLGRTFPEFLVGDRFGATVLITPQHLTEGAGLIGDFNPLHVDQEFARASPFGGCILHGVLTSAFISAPFGNLVAGTALGYLEHNTRFLAPVRPGDRLTIEWCVTDLLAKPVALGGIVVAEAEARNQHGTLVATALGKMLVANSAA
jgi:acyl dehydratase